MVDLIAVSRPSLSPAVPPVVLTPNPFIQGYLPKKGESPEERSQREQEEARAKAVSDAIDEQMRQDSVDFKRRQRAVKVFLLGQSESG